MLFALDSHAAYDLGADFEDPVDAYRALAPKDRRSARGLSEAVLDEADQDCGIF